MCEIVSEFNTNYNNITQTAESNIDNRPDFNETNALYSHHEDRSEVNEDDDVSMSNAEERGPLDDT